MRCAHALAVLAVAASLSAAAAVPDNMSYQGFLTSGGVPVTATVSMTLSLYDVPTSGTAVWSETKPVIVANGVYTVVLGSTIPLTPALLNGPRYLGVAVGTDPEMTPRTPLASAPYAILAKSLDGTLGVTGGGTGLASAASGGLLYGQGTGALGVTGAGSAGQVLTATAGGVPQWSNSTGGPFTISHPTWIVLQGTTFDASGVALPPATALLIGGEQVVGARQLPVNSATFTGGIDVGGANTRFSFGGTCSQSTLSAGASCTVTVSYNAGAPGSEIGDVVLVSTAPNSPHSVTLQALPGPIFPDVPGPVSVSTSILRNLDTVSPQTITFTNNTTSPVTFGIPVNSSFGAGSTDLNGLILRFNVLLERLRAHGLIAP